MNKAKRELFKKDTFIQWKRKLLSFRLFKKINKLWADLKIDMDVASIIAKNFKELK